MAGRARRWWGAVVPSPPAPAVHYPYQNWYFLPGPVGPGVSVLSYLLCWFLLCFSLALRFPSHAALAAAAFFWVFFGCFAAFG